MIVELPDEMVKRWLAGDGREGDDQIILAAIHRARTEPTIADPPPVWEGTRMNQQGRDKLRAEHQARDNGFLCRTCIRLVPDTDGFRGLNGIASPAKHPCDVIQVLDAWEEWLNNRAQITPPVDAQK